MKDALGHGSNAHNRGIDALARPVPVHPNVLRVIQKNPWGASVKPQTGAIPRTGYMVSLPGRTYGTTSDALSGPRGGKIIHDLLPHEFGRAPERQYAPWKLGRRNREGPSRRIGESSEQSDCNQARARSQPDEHLGQRAQEADQYRRHGRLTWMCQHGMKRCPTMMRLSAWAMVIPRASVRLLMTAFRAVAAGRARARLRERTDRLRRDRN